MSKLPTTPQPNHGWLAAVLPVTARRFRVTDPKLAATLENAGAELVEARGDVEIAAAGDFRGDARLGIAALERMARDDVSRVGRVVARLAGPIALRRDIATARAALLQSGYGQVEVATWDFFRALRLSGAHGRRKLAERLPRHAVVVGRRTKTGKTLLGAVESHAGAVLGGSLDGAPPSLRSGGILVTVGRRGVLRTAVGPARRHVISQVEALDQLRAAAGAGLDAGVIPWPLGHGRLGLADWSLERRLRGTTPGWRLHPRLIGAALDFLAALYSCGRGSTVKRSASDDAQVAASFVEPRRAEQLRSIGRRVAEVVAVLPHGFAHGDFFTRNLLVDGSRIVGVVDWEAAGPGRPPLLDFLHLWHMGQHKIGDLDWGPTIVSYLLPWARAGGDDVVRSFARRIGIDVTPARLEALVIAYWLARVADQLTGYADRAERTVWTARNVDVVLDALGSGT